MNQIYRQILNIEKFLDNGLLTNGLIVNCLLSTFQLTHFPLTPFHTASFGLYFYTLQCTPEVYLYT